MKKIRSTALCLFFFAFCTTAMAKAVDVEYAKELVRAKAYDGQKGYNFVNEQLQDMDRNEFPHLKALLEFGWSDKEGLGSPADLDLEGYCRVKIVILLNELLDTVPYTYIVEGRFEQLLYDDISSPYEDDHVKYYDFITKDGDVIHWVYPSFYMRKPYKYIGNKYYAYDINLRDNVRIFINTDGISKDFSKKIITDVRVLKNNPGSATWEYY